jgi:hypothetical protein
MVHGAGEVFSKGRDFAAWLGLVRATDERPWHWPDYLKRYGGRNRSSSRRQSSVKLSMTDTSQLSAQKPEPLSDRNTAFEQEGADLIGDAGALTDQSFSHTMQCL